MDNRLFIQVNQRTFANMSILNLSMSEAVNIACCYDTTFIRTPPYPTFTEVGGPHIELKQSDTSPIECLGYDVPESSKSSKSHTYTCTSKRPVLHVEIVLIYSRQGKLYHFYIQILKLDCDLLFKVTQTWLLVSCTINPSGIRLILISTHHHTTLLDQLL